MYKTFFGLPESPFELTPDPDFLYLTAQHQEALAGLSYAILGRKGFVVLTGDAGTGKTTLLLRSMRQLSRGRTHCGIIVNPTLSPSEFLEAAMIDLGFTEVPASKARRIALLQEFLWQGRKEGKISALIVDEAHNLSPEVLEEIRLLGNFESTKEKLLQVVLLGQNELNEILEREKLRQFKQRVAFWLRIEPLPTQEVGKYIQHRWTTAGGGAAPFSASLAAAIAKASGGIPRVINLICDNALIEAFVDGSRLVKPDHVATVCRDLRLPSPTPDSSRADAVAAPATFPPGAPSQRAAEFEPSLFRSLERYRATTALPSFLGRLRARLGINKRVETA